MIQLTFNQINQIYVTFTELMTDPNNLIQLVFTRDSNPDQEFWVLLGSNLSTSIGRYDLFNLELVQDQVDEDPLNAIIWLPSPGTYSYAAWEINNQVPFDPIDPDRIKIVEIGKTTVNGENWTSPELHPVYQ